MQFVLSMLAEKNKRQKADRVFMWEDEDETLLQMLSMKKAAIFYWGQSVCKHSQINIL